ncbi:MAG TPA: SGNH/GDSL hydrolase family protein [Polyangiaceae bacterium]|nr:SGNH/GDSL hydrolase family protein [Polyangiaceae bacterium]
MRAFSKQIAPLVLIAAALGCSSQNDSSATNAMTSVTTTATDSATGSVPPSPVGPAQPPAVQTTAAQPQPPAAPPPTNPTPVVNPVPTPLTPAPNTNPTPGQTTSTPITPPPAPTVTTGPLGTGGGPSTTPTTPAGMGSGGDPSAPTGTGGTMGGGPDDGPQHWVGTWTASPYLAASDAQPPMGLSGSTLRQVVHVSIGGSQLRLQLSNLSGNGPVSIKSLHLAICNATPAVDGSIDASTDTTVTFSGTEAVSIAQGMEVWSDTIDFTVPPLGNISITAAIDSVPSNLTAHAGSRTTSYVASGSDVTAADMTSASKGDHWYFISGIDVMAPASAFGVVAIGDSITDGRGTDTNHNNRWTDNLSARLQADPATSNVAVMNQGIGATNLLGSGTAAVARFKRDVIDQSGVKYAIIYDGVNDIGSSGTGFDQMKGGYEQLIKAGHDAGLKVIGATIAPFGGNSYYSAGHEQVRVQVNDYIKSGVFDGVIDFDKALTDGGNPPKLQATFAAWSQSDGLHPGPDGYKAMGDAIDLTLFK